MPPPPPSYMAPNETFMAPHPNQRKSKKGSTQSHYDQGYKAQRSLISTVGIRRMDEEEEEKK
jgi:hypothetical protein